MNRNYGYGYGQKQPEPPKPLPQWVVPAVCVGVFLLIVFFSMGEGERNAVAGIFNGASGKTIGIGVILAVIAGIWASQSETEGDAKARGGLVVVILAFTLLIVVILAVLDGVGFGNANPNAPQGIRFKIGK